MRFCKAINKDINEEAGGMRPATSPRRGRKRALNMRIVRSLAGGLVALTIAISVIAAEKPSDRPMTLGDFLGAYARTLNVELPKDAGPATIAAALRAAGVKLGDKL